MSRPPKLTLSILLPFVLLVVAFISSPAIAQACAAGSAKQINGNWYCSEVDAITYHNFPGYGQYNKVTHMDPKTGECETKVNQYSGSLSPLDEELSIHVRGPIWLKGIEVYEVGEPMEKKPRDLIPAQANGARNHKHGFLHARRKKSVLFSSDEIVKRGVGDLVEATIDGKRVSWINGYAGAPATSVSQPKEPSSQPKASSTNDKANQPQSKSRTQPTTSLSALGSDDDPAEEDWVPTAYYDAEAGSSQGLTFLNHFGGTKGIPGTAEGGSAFGASLSHASSDGKAGAASSEVLKDAVVDDNVEIIIMSDRPCENGACGYVRPGGVSYHGFGGSYKVFVITFSMPLSGKSTFNGDMPGIWLLNAQVPLTSQYGTNADCSCWKSGCGEFDIFEVLDPGNHRCKSTLHMAPAGGSSDWFMRPTKEPITVAVVFGGERGILIKVLEEGSQTFGANLSKHLVDTWIKGKSSSFKMGS